MYKLAHIIMVILLSFSIASPSVISLYSDHYDMEITKDIGEEDTKEKSTKELEEKDTFLETFSTPQLTILEDTKVDVYCYYPPKSSFTLDIQVPPPQVHI